MATYTDYTQDPGSGGVFLHKDDGTKELHDPSNPSVYLETARIDEDKARLAKDDARLAANDPAPPDVPGFGYDGLASPDPRVGAFARAQQADTVSRPDVQPSLAPDPVDSLPPVAASPPNAAPRASAPTFQGTAPAAPAPAVNPGNISFGARNAPGAAPAQGRLGSEDTDQIVSLSHDLTLQALRQQGGGGQRVKGATFETGHVREKGDAVDPGAIAGAQNAIRTTAEAQRDQQQAQADLNYQVVDRQTAATDAIESDAAMRRLDRDAAMKDLHEQQLADARDISGASVDTSGSHFWGSKTSGQKVQLGIAMALSGVGAALETRGTGQAVDSKANAIIQGQIAGDVQEQKDKIARKEKGLSELGEAYKRYRQLGLDDERATEATKSLAKERIAVQATAIANASGNPLAIARAQQLTAESNEQGARLNLSVKEDEAKRSSTRTNFATTQDHIVGGGMSLEKKIKLAHDQGAFEAATRKSDAEAGAALNKNGGPNGQTVRAGGETFALPGIEKEEAHDLRKKLAATNDVLATLDQLEDLHHAAAGGAVIQTKEIQAVQSQLAAKISVANGQGAMTGEEAARAADMVSGIRGSEGVKALRANVKAAQRATLDTVGAKPVD